MPISFNGVEQIQNESAPAALVVQSSDKDADHQDIERCGTLDRRLRNLFLLANAIAWAMIIIFLRSVLF